MRLSLVLLNNIERFDWSLLNKNGLPPVLWSVLIGWFAFMQQRYLKACAYPYRIDYKLIIIIY